VETPKKAAAAQKFLEAFTQPSCEMTSSVAVMDANEPMMTMIPFSLHKVPSISTFASLVAAAKDVKRPATPQPSPVRIEYAPDPIPLDMKKALISVSMGILDGVRTQLVSEGMGGAYFCRDQKGTVHAVFKPSDEEPCGPNNPKNLTGVLGSASIKPGILSGEQANREVAAYLLDHGRFAGVPTTLLVSINTEVNKSKLGSFQVFVPFASASGDFGPSLFPTRDVQAIAALDLRLVNTDRHDGNILVQESVDHATLTTSHRLIPIDHGCALPDRLHVSSIEWAWMSWPQAKLPILPSVRESILAVNIDNDAQVLRSLKIRPECIRTMRIATKFLQTCVRCNDQITLFDIAAFMSRTDFDTPSRLERLIAQCRWKAALRCVCVSVSSGVDGRDFDFVFMDIFEHAVANSMLNAKH
jgi:hypothetical protein